MATKKKKFWQSEAFSKRQAEALYSDGPKYLLYTLGALLAVYIAYFATKLEGDFAIVSPSDKEKLKEILTSGSPWLVLCKRGDLLPDGFSDNLKHLGVTKAALVDCDSPLPKSGLTISAKYKLDRKKKPTGFLTFGGKRIQLDHKLLEKDEKLALSQTIRKAVAKRYAITDINDAAKLRGLCSKAKCVVWSRDYTYFGPRIAVQYPKWVHYRIGNELQIGGRKVKGAAIIWPLPNDEHMAVFVDEDSKVGSDVVAALQMVNDDPSFAATKAEKLGWEWVKTSKKASSTTTAQQRPGGNRRTATEKQKAQEKEGASSSKKPPEEAKIEELNQDNLDGSDEDDDDADAIDLDEM